MRTCISAIIPFLMVGFSLAQNTQPDYTIVYTGRTLGYLRIPDSQSLNQVPAGPPSCQADMYVHLIEKIRDSRSGVFLFGMGDNFAPNFLARTFQLGASPFDRDQQPSCTTEPSAPARRVGKDGYFYDGAQGRWRPNKEDKSKPRATEITAIPYDNVAQFFIQAQYNALVPGKHDFYYGPQRLRELAKLLEVGHVRMLAANLVLSTTLAPSLMNVHPRIPDRLRAYPYSIDFGEISPDLPDMVLPYKQQFLIRNAAQLRDRADRVLSSADLAEKTRKDVVMLPRVSQAEICVEPGTETSGDPRTVAEPGASCMKLIEASVACGRDQEHLRNTCKQLSSESGPLNPETPATGDLVYLFESKDSRLKAGLNHRLCITTDKPNDWKCKPFQTQIPMLYSDEERPNLDEAGPADPFKIVTSKDKSIAVFGVVDPDLLANVGLLNDSWLNTHHRFDTAAKAAPADYTLLQALELCNRRSDCASAPKILLAQMPYAKAAQLVANSNFVKVFDIVISQADPDHYTANRTVSITPSGGKIAAQFLVTPWDPAFKPGSFTPAISAVGVRKSAAEWKMKNELNARSAMKDPLPPDGPGPHVDVANVAGQYGGVLDPSRTSVPSASDLVVSAALRAMREDQGTDVAILQNRDLYNANFLASRPVPQAEFQNEISRIFWKGDYVVTLHLTGATLKKLYKQSAKFEELDHDALATDVQRGRSLLFLGFWNDRKDPSTYYINGAKLNDTALYSVATTDFLAFGDTGYADLATPDVPPAQRLKDLEHLRPLAGLVCHKLTHDGPSANPGIPCDEDESSRDTFDFVKAKPFDQTPGYSTLAHYRTFFRQLRPQQVPAAAGEGRAQQRNLWQLNLENLDVNYSGTYINHVSNVQTTFAGVSAPGVTLTGNNSLGADHKLRLIYDFHRGTFYALSDSAYTRTSTSAGPYPAISNNMWGLEGGGTWRIPYATRPSWFSFQYSARFEGQLTEPSPTQITITPEAGAPTHLALPVPQISSIFGRLGFRAELADTYIEAGVEEIDSRNLLTQYAFNTSSGPIYCSPNAQYQLGCGTDSALFSLNNKTPIAKETSLAIPGLMPTTISTADFLNSGAYFNFSIKFPLWSRVDANGADQSYYFTITNKGDLYFNRHNDISVQTRYLDKLSPSFSLPIYGKLMLTPRVDFILYENKVFRNHYRAVVPMISVSYSFQRRQGMEKLPPLRYGAATTTQPVTK
jgi:hypothetical protein